VRQWLQQLLKANLLRGSMESGLSVHDLVRDCMIRRAEVAREGGLRALQREALPLLVAAYDANGPATAYVSSSLRWHVGQSLSRQPAEGGGALALHKDALHEDALLMGVLRHTSGTIRAQGALGIGSAHGCAHGCAPLRAAADAADDAGEHLAAAEIMFAAAATVPGNGPATELKRAWESLQLLAPDVRASAAAIKLEKLVLPTLTMSAAYTFGSDEHNEALARVQVISTQYGGGGGEAGAGAGSPGTAAPTQAAILVSEMLRGSAAILAMFGIEGIIGHNGPLTLELVAQSAALVRDGVSAYAAALAAAPDALTASHLDLHCAFLTLFCQRQHALPDFRLQPEAREETGGERGARLRQLLHSYDFETVHPVAKATSFNCDFTTFGFEALFLLLFAGDLAGAKAGALKMMRAHKRMLTKVLDEGVAADVYPFEAFNAPGFLGALLLLTGEKALLREFMAWSLVGHFLTDDAIRQVCMHNHVHVLPTHALAPSWPLSDRQTHPALGHSGIRAALRARRGAALPCVCA
jgi:hypothetical protein